MIKLEILILSVIAILLIVCATLLALTWVEIARITNNLKQIQKKKTNQKLKLSYSNPLLEAMAEQINQLIEQKRDCEIKYNNKNLQQRQEIANISHDLRTPLTSVIGYLQLLQDEDLPLAQRKQNLDIVLTRAKSLQALIVDFFELSRCEAGEGSINLQPIRLQDILCELIAAYYNDFLEQGIEPHIEINDSAPHIIVDESAVRRIYQNLTQNTLKHGSGKVEISLGHKGDQLITCFSNNASMLTKEDVERLFDRSYTADKMRSKGNTGLGLSIVKALVEQMNGKIIASLKDGILSIIITWSINLQ